MNKISRSDYKVLHQFLESAEPLSEDLFEEIRDYISKKTYKKGEAILRAGDIEVNSNIVVKGVVLQYVFDEDIPITINITPKGLSFNSLKSYIDGSPSVEIHEAITDVEILTIKKNDLEMLAKKYHEFSYIMYKVYEKI
ncbi:cyclic nucleotide-binding domain-containing protein, partial [Limibacter armeniacum]